jgi:hypothetical protein
MDLDMIDQSSQLADFPVYAADQRATPGEHHEAARTE